MDETATGEPVSLDNQNWFFSLYLWPPKGRRDGVIRHQSKRENGNLGEKIALLRDRLIRHPLGLCKLVVNVNFRHLWTWFVRKNCVKAEFRIPFEYPWTIGISYRPQSYCLFFDRRYVVRESTGALRVSLGDPYLYCDKKSFLDLLMSITTTGIMWQASFNVEKLKMDKSRKFYLNRTSLDKSNSRSRQVYIVPADAGSL